MAKERNLPIDKEWAPKFGPEGKNHEYIDGEYVEVPYTFQKYPKTKYHQDYVHDRKEGVEYQYTQVPQTVKNADEEEALGAEWKDSPADFGIITAPDAETQAKKRKAVAAAGSNWRASLPNSNPQVTDLHLRFLQDNGVEVKNMGDVYTFLAGMTSSQMNSFLAEAKEWEKSQLVGASKGKK